MSFVPDNTYHNQDYKYKWSSKIGARTLAISDRVRLTAARRARRKGRAGASRRVDLLDRAVAVKHQHNLLAAQNHRLEPDHGRLIAVNILEVGNRVRVRA